MFFDTNTSFLKTAFDYSSASAGSETIVYLNQELWYPDGYQVYVTKGYEAPHVMDQSAAEGNYFKVNVNEVLDQQLAEGDKITITVYKRD